MQVMQIIIGHLKQETQLKKPSNHQSIYDVVQMVL